MLSFFCCNPEIATTFWAVMVFFPVGLDLLVDCNGFEGLHQNRFSFICRNLLMWWHFRLAARHFIDSSLKWSFRWFPEQSFVLEEFSDFFCVKFLRLFMKGKSSSRKSAFFYRWLPIAFTPTSAFVFTCERGFTFLLNWSTFAAACDPNRILKTTKFWNFAMET